MQKSLSGYEGRVSEKTMRVHYNILYIVICLIVTITVLAARSNVAADISGYKHYKTSAISMVPTLLHGEFILVNHDCYKDQKPQRGDIIVFECPNDPSKKMVKRVIAIERDVIRGENKNIYLNGHLIDEPYVQHTIDHIVDKMDNFGPLTVPDDTLFVMGDNRDESLDSRLFGVVGLEKVKGRAVCVQWSKQPGRKGSQIE